MTTAPMRLLSRHFAQLELKSVVASTSKKTFTTSPRSRQASTTEQESIDELLTGELSGGSPAAAGSSSGLPQFPTPSREEAGPARAGGFRNSGPSMARYRLHAHCAKHNTILSLTRGLPSDMEHMTPRAVLNSAEAGTLQAGSSSGSVDPKIYGQTVLRSSCGTVGFKKGQRSTFEAATRASNQMFDMIEQLGRKERKTKEGKRIIDPEPTEITLVLKGFGQGREAVFAALQTDAGKRVKNMIRRVTDATPIKIGGTRPRKRRNIGYSQPRFRL